MSDEEFGELTPRQFKALIHRFEQEQEHKDWYNACLCTAIINTSMYRPEKPVKISDFMPQHSKQQPPEKPTRMTAKKRKEVAMTLKQMFAAARPKGKQ